MITGRLRECLKILRWKAEDLADELGYKKSEVIGWLDGRDVAPFAVAAWIEALVKAHRALPPPRQDHQSNLKPGAAPIELTNVEDAAAAVEHPGSHGIPMRPPYSRRDSIAGVRAPRVPMHPKGGSSHGYCPL